ncbi:Protein of unknown function, partial [Janthinobacterium sp. TND4EL3]|uniref:effector protein Tle3 domain-containing protein n=1 Tax=Janthinobacterium sp. TND4EL3 TaxID=1907311 RepID=UPI0009568EC7
TPDAEYLQWRSTRVEEMMASQAGAYATDHSTILTNPMHSERALAYDVAVGVCRIKPDQLRKLRVAADWRLLEVLSNAESAKLFEEYFIEGKFHGQTITDWTQQTDGGGSLPASIVDVRENSAPDSHPHSGERAFS